MTNVMDITQALNAFKRGTCNEIEIVRRGMDKYAIHVPMTFSDGDHYAVMLQKEEREWFLTDNGHTFMHLSINHPRFSEGRRWETIQKILRASPVENINGELRLDVDIENPGDALFSFLQVVIQISDVSLLDTETVRSTFIDDFRALIAKIATTHVKRPVEFDYCHPIKDQQRLYPVSARLNGSGNLPVLLFAIGSDDQCQKATITLYKWEQWGEKFRSIGVFRDQTAIGRPDLSRFTDIVQKQYSSLASAEERLGLELSGLSSNSTSV